MRGERPERSERAERPEQREPRRDRPARRQDNEAPVGFEDNVPAFLRRPVKVEKSAG